jgi:hypothetical protein
MCDGLQKNIKFINVIECTHYMFFSFLKRLKKIQTNILYMTIGILCHWIPVNKYSAYTIYHCGVTYLLKDIYYVNSFQNIVCIDTYKLPG